MPAEIVIAERRPALGSRKPHLAGIAQMLRDPGRAAAAAALDAASGG